MNSNRLFFGALLILMSSCADTIHLKTMSYAPIYFDTLLAKPTGDYLAEAELLFKKNVMVDKEQARNYKQLSFSNRVLPVVVDAERKNTFRSRWNARRARNGSIRASFKLAADPTYDLALFNLVEKYPNVDYWTNIRVERDVVGRRRIFGRYSNTFYKNGIEHVKITATGVDILSDAEIRELNKPVALVTPVNSVAPTPVQSKSSETPSGKPAVKPVKKVTAAETSASNPPSAESNSITSGFPESVNDGISSIDEFKRLGFAKDTASLKFSNLEKIAPYSGYYLVCAMYLTEDKCNRQIKKLYLEKITSFKIYDSVNKYYYVYLKVKETEESANQELYKLQELLPQVWVRQIK